jgi:hypothetical protein
MSVTPLAFPDDDFPWLPFPNGMGGRVNELAASQRRIR